METCIDHLEQSFIENKVYHEVQEHRQVFTIQEVAVDLHVRRGPALSFRLDRIARR